jgi:hypothetical protein
MRREAENTPPVWLAPDGAAVACVEKIKVLNENLTEFRQLAQDLLDDAVLMGCCEKQIIDTLQRTLEALSSNYASLR